MLWMPLSDRLEQLPLILAGPILRRTEPDAVTVWLALRKPCRITLQVYATDEEARLKELILEGSRSTIALGQALHVVALTAHPLNGTLLEAGQVYAYDLALNQYKTSLSTRLDYDLQQALNSPYCPPVTISYFDHQLPTFALPPADLNQLKIAHGSCRKPHGGGRDLLPVLDDLINQSPGVADSRPHQLFLTGDQIYGDEVADPLLWLLTDAGDTLLGWEENLPIQQQHGMKPVFQQPRQLQPGQRSQIATIHAGLTAALHNQPMCAKSHLLSLGEYYSTYLFTWSQVLWPSEFPKGKVVFRDSKDAKQWDQEVIALQTFTQNLWQVRRLLANIPTYTIFDDHDISDDWYLNQDWCMRVLGKPLGRRVVQNGLLAYTIFQAWGNTPQQFQPEQPGGKLLAAAANWSASAGTDFRASEAIAQYIGLPPQHPQTGFPKLRQDADVWVLERDSQALDWHYVLRSHKHEVIVLDTRTRRGYPIEPAAPTDPPMLLSPSAFVQQIQVPLEQTDQLKQAGNSEIAATIVLAPTNLVNLKGIDWVQEWSLRQGKVYQHDVGDGWNMHKGAFIQLLATLFARRQQVVVLSGDIHYGFAARLRYWSKSGSNPFALQDVEKSQVLAQLTSSPLKNSEWKTKLIHTKIKSLVPEQTQHCKGRSGWEYHVDWIQRQSAQPFDWKPIKQPAQLQSKSKQHPWLQRIQEMVAWLWNNRWLQEGKEIVGRNNLGLVTFEQATKTETLNTVHQNLYWYSSWKKNHVVSSKFSVPLSLNLTTTRRRSR